MNKSQGLMPEMEQEVSHLGLKAPFWGNPIRSALKNWKNVAPDTSFTDSQLNGKTCLSLKDELESFKDKSEIEQEVFHSK